MPRKRKKAALKGLPATKKFSGKVYKKSTCTRLKSDANKRAKKLREKGTKARVVKQPGGGYCLYTK